jgi:hypothetical protein
MKTQTSSALLLACGIITAGALGACDGISTGTVLSSITPPSGDAGGNGMDSGGNGSDSGANADDSGPPAPQPDANADGEAGPTPTPPPQPTLLVSGSSIDLWGITTDGFVIYREGGTLSAVALQGGSPIAITSDPLFERVDVRGPGVLYWTNDHDSSTVATLHAWTKAAGAHTIASSVPLVYATTADVSPDGTKVGFFAVDAQGAWSVATSAIDGGQRATVSTPGIAAPQNVGAFRIEFAPNGTLLASYVLAPTTDGGPVDVGLTYLTPLGASRSLEGGILGSFARDAAGAHVFWVDPSGNASVVTVADGTTTAVDTGVATIGTRTNDAAVFDPSGANVYYLTQSGALRGALVANPVPRTLVATATDVVSVAPDQSRVLFHAAVGTTWFMRSIPGSGGATADVAEHILVAAFTADSSRVVFLTNPGETDVRSLEAVPAAGGATTTFETDVDLPFDPVPIGGTSFFTQVSGDVLRFDALGKGAPVTLAAHATRWIATPDASKITFTTSAGLYVVATH